MVLRRLSAAPDPWLLLRRLTRRLVAHYLSLLLDAFAVDRQIEIFLPIHYGQSAAAEVGEKTNLDLKQYYFGGSVPSLCTCLFNERIETLSGGATTEEAVTEALSEYKELQLPITVERLLILDKFYKVAESKAVRKEAEKLCKSLFKRLFSEEGGVRVSERRDV